MFLGGALMTLTFWVFRRARPHKVDGLFRVLQLASSAFFSLAHGANDAQKTMGIIVGLLVASQALFAQQTGLLSHLHLVNADHVPMWIVLGAHASIAAGTLAGGCRIVHTMGQRITRLRPVGGFAAETGGAISIFLATYLGIPVSTTHTISGSIVGVGAANRFSSVRWGLAGRIVWAWILTIPVSAAIAAIAYFLLRLVGLD
jgi:PiT family inorganic phosphate transporter